MWSVLLLVIYTQTPRACEYLWIMRNLHDLRYQPAGGTLPPHYHLSGASAIRPGVLRIAGAVCLSITRQTLDYNGLIRGTARESIAQQGWTPKGMVVG